MPQQWCPHLQICSPFHFLVRSSATWPNILSFRYSVANPKFCSAGPNTTLFSSFTKHGLSPTPIAKHQAPATPTSCASHVVASIFFCHNTQLKMSTTLMSSPGSASLNLRMSYPGTHFQIFVTRLRPIRCLDDGFVMVWQGRGYGVLQPQIPCPTCTVTSVLETTQNWASNSPSDTAVLDGETPSAN